MGAPRKPRQSPIDPLFRMPSENAGGENAGGPIKNPLTLTAEERAKILHEQQMKKQQKKEEHSSLDPIHETKKFRGPGAGGQ